MTLTLTSVMVSCTPDPAGGDNAGISTDMAESARADALASYAPRLYQDIGVEPCGAAELFADHWVTALATDGASLYWGDRPSEDATPAQTSIVRATPPDGTPQTLLVGHYPMKLLVDASHIYWLDLTHDANNYPQYSIRAATTDGNQMKVLASFDMQTHLTTIALGPQMVYFGGYRSGWGTGFVAGVPKDGGEIVSLANSLYSSPEDILFDGDLIVAAGQGGLHRISLTGSDTPIVTGGPVVYPKRLAFDATWIYIGDEEFGISAVPRFGGPAQRLVPDHFVTQSMLLASERLLWAQIDDGGYGTLMALFRHAGNNDFNLFPINFA